MLLTLRLLVLAAVTAVLAPVAHGADTWFVRKDASGAATGQSWQDAFTDLQAALAVADSGDQIWVAAATYKPDGGTGLQDLSFNLRPGVAVFGGFAGTESHLDERDIVLNPTVLSGDLNGDDDPAAFSAMEKIADNSDHVVACIDVGSTATLDGFTVTGGVGVDAPEGACATAVGGGLVISNSAATIRNCTFTRNQAVLGGGCYIGHSDDVVIESCSFIDNISQLVGGAGIALCESAGVITDSRFQGNQAKVFSPGGGILAWNGSSPHVLRCQFVENFTKGGGAGVAASEDSSPFIDHCVFLRNSAGNGAVLFQGSEFERSSNGTLRDCALIDNEAFCGGAIAVNTSSPTIESCTIVGNRSELPEAGGVFVFGLSPTVIIRSSILWGNVGAGVVSEVAQLWNATESFDVMVVHSCIQQWTQGRLGNISVDPLFIDLDGADDVLGTEDDNVALTRDSPCVDAGSPAAYPFGTDLLGGARLIDGDLDGLMSADMGAAEYSAVRLHAEVTGEDTKQVTVAVESDVPLWGFLMVGLAEDSLLVPPFGSVFLDMSKAFTRVKLGVLPVVQTFTVSNDPLLPRRIRLQAVGVVPTDVLGNVSNALWLEL